MLIFEKNKINKSQFFNELMTGSGVVVIKDVFSLAQIITDQNYTFDTSAFERITAMISAFDIFLEKGFMLGVGYFNLQFHH